MTDNGLGYSQEFKLQVVDYIKSGHTIAEAINHFQIARATIYKYMEQASFKYARTPVLDPQAVRSFVEQNPYLKMSEYARHFGMSQTNMPKIMKRYGIEIKTEELKENELLQYVKENPHLTLKDYAEHFNVHYNTIGTYLKRLNIKQKNIKVWEIGE